MAKEQNQVNNLPLSSTQHDNIYINNTNTNINNNNNNNNKKQKTIYDMI